MYATIKLLHMSCAVISIAGFLIRGLLMLTYSPLLRRRWMRIVPHVNDTLLLAAAVALTAMLGQYPFVDAWLTAKLAGLFAYIGLGILALREGRSRPVRLACWLGALATAGYIVSVAVTKDPHGFLAWL